MIQKQDYRNYLSLLPDNQFDERMRFSSVVIVTTSAVLAYLSKLDATTIQDGSLSVLMGFLLIAINVTAIQFISKSR